MSNLKPCPFCGTSDVRYFDNEPPFDGYVLCNQCHARGPRMPSSAVSKWNTRTAAPRVKQLVWVDRVAMTPFPFSYKIEEAWNVGEWIVTFVSSSEQISSSYIGTLGQFKSEHEVKDGAQADYERRILSVLETT